MNTVTQQFCLYYSTSFLVLLLYIAYTNECIKRKSTFFAPKLRKKAINNEVCSKKNSNNVFYKKAVPSCTHTPHLGERQALTISSTFLR